MPHFNMTHHAPLSDATLALLLASLARQDFVLLETTRISGDEHRSLLFSNPVNRITLTAEGKAAHFLNEARDWLERGYFLAGWLGYEFGYLLEPVLAKKLRLASNQPVADLGVFPPPVMIDHLEPPAKQTAGLPLQAAQPLPADARYAIRNLRFNLDKKDYLAAIAAIKAYIAAGDTYQVNYTLKLLFDFSGDPAALYRALRRNQSVAYGAYIQTGQRRILSLSPELFFRRQADICTVRPMKGTMRRGRTTAEDRQHRHFLRTDSKNLSENVMIVDLLRNDLGRLARPATVRVSSLFDVETYETLHQMTSTISAELPRDVQLFELLTALFPCGSVTGAPKIRTMEIINELEHSPRGVYTGAIGYLDPCGDAVFNVPIRTIVLDEQGRGEMGIGSGIVHDSDGENEWQECRLKADFLTRPCEDFQLIETMLWQPAAGFWLLNRHLARLQDSAAYFQFPCDLAEITAALDRLGQSFAAADTGQRVRLLLARDGAVTVSAAPCAQPQCLVAPGGGQLPQVRFAAARTDSRDVFLYHKTTRRRLYDQEREKAVSDGYYEVLFVNERGEVTEGAISTVFVRQGEVWYTPPLQCGLLPGVFRAHFLAASPQPVTEKNLFPQDLLEADAVYVANSVRGLVRVSCAGGFP